MLHRNLLVDLLSILFGIGAWVSINGLWVELPLLVKNLPEGWNLPSYMSIVIQIANIGPITYSLVRLCCPSIKPAPIIHGVVIIGTVASLLLAMFWNKTTQIQGVDRSTALLGLLFCLSLVDCTSSVLYIPYMAEWKNIYLPSYLIGEGFSGLLPALVALGQGVGGNAECHNVSRIDNSSGEIVWEQYPMELQPNFSVTIFLYFLFGMMTASCLAFMLLEHLPLLQKERANELDSQAVSTHPGPNPQEYELVNSSLTPHDGIIMKKYIFIFFLAVQAWSSMLANGLLPSIQSFSCGPYGDIPYHLAATLSALANPLAALSTMVLPRAPAKIIGFLSILGTAFGCYIFATAAMSPAPPLINETIGSILIVFVWVSFSGIISYVRIEIANLMRQIGAQPLFWSGVLTQAGAAVGAVTAFVLVNKVNLFQYYNPCA